MQATGGKTCELCEQAASLYCEADSAFLCYTCDAGVHRANFLVARHFRQPLCSKCTSLSPYGISGARISPRDSLCHSCSMNNCPDDPDLSSSSCLESSACISSVESAVPAAKNNIRPDCHRRKGDAISASSSMTESSGRNMNPWRSRYTETKVEGIIESWCNRLGLQLHVDASTALVSNVMAFCISSTRSTALPLRISLAASFWLGLRLCAGESRATWQNLKQLEKVAGVPSKLILAAAAKLGPSGRVSRAPPDLQEGWAEC